MIVLLLALLAPSNSASSLARGLEGGLLLSTIEHSEWCPPGNVRLDLGSGEYLLQRFPSGGTCMEAGVQREVKRGTLAPADLELLRAAALRAQTEGLLNPDCRGGGKPRELVFSNGGVPRLVLSTERGQAWAPNDLSCWSGAADDLHHTLDRTFREKVPR